MKTQMLFENNQDFDSPNKNITPLNTRVDSNGRLIVGGCFLGEIAKEYGTPAYILDELTIRKSCRAYVKSLRRYYPGESLPLYASKANSSLCISSIIASEGFGLDAVSEGELITALKGGVISDNIVFHGNNKSYNELLIAYNNNVTIVLDNQHDIDLLNRIVNTNSGRKVQLMLRFTPGIECHTHDYIRTGHIDSKFGFSIENVKNTLNQLKQFAWANLIGIHAHIGSQIFELQPHSDLIEVMLNVYEYALQIGHPVKDLNVGGGLGIKYVSSDDPPSIDSWIKTISETLIDSCKRRNIQLPRLICEPGRSIIATAGITLYKVGARKEINGLKTYISVDGGMSDNPRPITYESLYTALLVDKAISENNEIVTIAGKHCESGDVLLKEYSLPRSLSGDYLGIFGTGAYNLSMSSNYNRIPRPPTVLVKDGISELIQKREMPEDLLQFDLLPDRFIAKG